MKRFVILSVLLAAVAAVVPSVEAKTSGPTSVQDRIAYLGPPVRGFQRRGRRVVTRTRVRWIGRYRYRETIRTVYQPNGRSRTTVIRRVRLAGRRY